MSESGNDRDPLDEIAEEFLARYRRGEHPSVSEFAARARVNESDLRELLSALLMVERLKPQGSELDGRTGRGQARGLRSDLEQLGDYRILREVGRGGMGVVYEAEQISLGRHVALKVLSTGIARTPQQIQRFVREARSAAQLHHSNIVPVFGVGEQDGIYYYAMQFICGHGLDSVLEEVLRHRGELRLGNSRNRATPLNASSDPLLTALALSFISQRNVQEPEDNPPSPDSTADFPGGSTLAVATNSDRHYSRSVAQLGVQMSDALEYAHRQGTLHRDIKPSNLMLDGRGTVWVTDFGLAKAAEDDDLTRTGDLVGTLRYMAPERFRGLCDARSDVYGLGLTLYELLALRPAFNASGREQLAYEITHKDPPRLRSLGPGVPRDLETIIHKAIEKNPGDRYPTAGSLADDLRCYLENRPIGARRVGSTERLTRWARRNPGLATLGTAVAGLLALTVAIITVSDIRLRREHAIALSHLNRATNAESDAVGKLLESSLAHSRAGRRGGASGRRFDGLSALEEATRLDTHRSRLLEFRNEAIACLALADLRPSMFWPDNPEDGYLAFDFDPDLQRVARGTKNGDVLIHEKASSSASYVLPGKGGRAVLARFSPDGRYLAIKHEDRNHLELAIWDVIARRLLLRVPDGIHASALDFHPDGEHVAVGLRDGSIVVYNLPDGKEEHRLPPSTVPFFLRFDHTGSRIAVVSPNSDETLQVRSIANGEVLASWREPAQAFSAEWHPRGHWLAAGGEDGRIHLFDPAKPTTAPKILVGHTGACVSIAVHPAGKLLASASWDGSTRLWDTTTGREQVTAPVIKTRALRFSRDGRYLAPGDDGESTWIWELADGRELRSYSSSDLQGAATWSVDLITQLGVLVSAGSTGIRLENLHGDSPSAFIPLPGTRDVAVSPDGRILFSSGASGLLTWPVVQSTDGVIIIGPPDATHPLSGQATGRLCLSRDGKTLAVVVDEEGGRVVIMDRSDHSRRVEIVGHRNLERLDLSPDGRWLATGTWKGDGVKIWDTRSGRWVRDLPVRGSADVLFSQDGCRLVTGSGYEYTIWETTNWNPVHRFPRSLAGEMPGSAAFREDGKVLALARTRSLVQLVDVESGRELAALEAADPRHVYGLGFSADSQHLVLTSNSAEIRAWNLQAIRKGLSSVALDWDDPAGTKDVGSFMSTVTSFVVKPAPWLASFNQGEEHTRAGRWDQAIASYREGIEAGDPGPEVWTRLAFVLSLHGDHSAYQEACQHLVKRYGDLRIAPVNANNIAWSCTLRPESLTDYQSAIQLAEMAAAGRLDTNRLNTLGAVLFRAGRHSEALVQLQRAVAKHGAGGTPYDAVFLAMVHHELGHVAEAREWLRRAGQPAPITMRKPDDNRPSSWIPRMELEHLRREASLLIAPPSS